MNPYSSGQILRLRVAACAAAVLATAEALAQGSPAVLEEVVVVARQRSERLQDVPLSVAAVSGRSLRALRIDTLQEMEYSVPNLVFGETGTSGETHVGIRGIGDFSRNIGFDTRVGVYVDGVFAGQSLAVDQGLGDVAQVEVLRGPQGTLFGKNSSSGVINILTNKPELGSTTGSLSLGAGNYDNRNGSGVLNLPLGDIAALRVSLIAQQQDGYVDNLATGEELMSNDHWQARARLRIRPGEALDVVISADLRDQDNDILFLEPDASYERAAGNPAAAGRFDVDQDGPLRDDNDGWGVSVSVDYGVWNDYLLSSITAYREAERRVGSDEDATRAYALHVKWFEDEFRHFTQELRIASPTDCELAWVAGLYWFEQRADQDRVVVLGPAFGAPPDFPGGVSTGSVDTSAWAAFVNGTWTIDERWSLGGGLRWTDEEKDASFDQFTLPAFGLANFSGYEDRLDDGNVTATANLRYAFAEDMHAYFTWSRGHKSGGWNADYVGSTADLPFDEETVDSFEAGLKSELLDGRLRLNVAAFRAEYDDFQVFQFQFNGDTTNLIVSNAASVVTEGVEIEGIASLAESFELIFGLGYAEAEFDDFPGGAVDADGSPLDASGNSLPRAPELTTTLTARYRYMLGSIEATAVLNHTYRDTQYFNPDNLARSRQDGYGLINASLELGFAGGWTLSAWGRNLGDEEYRTMRGVSFLGVPFSLWGQPRTWGVDIGYSF